MWLQGKNVRVVITWSKLGQSDKMESQTETRLAEVIKWNKEMLTVSACESKECHWRVWVLHLRGKGKLQTTRRPTHLIVLWVIHF